MENPTTDTAELCDVHPSCIRGFKRYAAGNLMGLAGWWHLRWDQGESRWHLTDPSGGTREVRVGAGAYPPGALVGAVSGLVFAEIVTAIEEKSLFPPPAELPV